MQATQALRFAAQTDKGLRQSNADAVFADHRLFMVADGVGTGKNSGLASKMVLTRITEAIADGAQLTEAVQQAHVMLREFNLQHSGQQPVGTTIVTAHLDDTSGSIVWVGDSRAYLIDVQKNHVAQLTQDHSLVNKLVQRGELTQEQARAHPKRNVITRCLGLTQQEAVKMDSQTFTLLPGQILLLCSDGLSGSLTDAALLQCLQQANSLNTRADNLLQAALQAGSRDNISVVLVEGM